MYINMLGGVGQMYILGPAHQRLMHHWVQVGPQIIT